MVQLGFYDDQSDESAASAALVQATLIAMWWLSNFSRQAKHAAFHSGGKKNELVQVQMLLNSEAQRQSEKKKKHGVCPVQPYHRAVPVQQLCAQCNAIPAMAFRTEAQPNPLAYGNHVSANLQ